MTKSFTFPAPTCSPLKRNAFRMSGINDCLVMDSIYGYIPPAAQDFLLTDLGEKELTDFAERLGVRYLSPATAIPGTFPVEGDIIGSNRRLIINLVCKGSPFRPNPSAPVINVVFLVVTGSPYSYLSEKAMKALFPDRATTPRMEGVQVQGDAVIECYLSGGHFADVNILGMDFLCKFRLSVAIDHSQSLFRLTQDASV